MEQIKVNTYRLKQYCKEMENLGEALLEAIPDMEGRGFNGKGKAPEQIQEAEGNMDGAASNMYYLLQETIQVLKRTEEHMEAADKGMARTLERLY